MSSRSAAAEETAEGQGQDQRAFASSLEPALREACEGRLGTLTWFRTDWQRGGAATATADYQSDDGTVPVVVKLPVVQRELKWTRRLQSADGPAAGVAATLLASGYELGGYDLAWLVIERLPCGPLGTHWHDRHVARIADAATRFTLAASMFAVDQQPRFEDWDSLISDARKNVRSNHIDYEQRWNQALKALSSRLDRVVDEWRARPTNDWLHGDVHLANAMCREDAEDAPVSLIDLAEIRVGHWIEDAIYLERQLWPRPDRLKPHKPVRSFVEARRALGLTVDDGYARLADIRRGLLAATAPRFLKSEGHPVYLEACLKRLEQALQQVR